MHSIYLILYALIFFGLFIWAPNEGLRLKQIGLTYHHNRIFYIELAARFVIVMNIGGIVIFGLYRHQLHWFAVILQLGAVVIFYIAKKTMGESWSTNIGQEEQLMVQDGIYRFSRNPVYLAYHLSLISFCLYDSRFLLMYACFALVFHLLILEEEKWLTQVFGETFIAYQKKTRRYI